MRKKLTCLISAVIMMAIITANVIMTSATSVKSTFVNDDFAAETINTENWDAADGATIQNYGGAIKINNNSNYANSVGWKGLRNENLDKNGGGEGLYEPYVLETTISMLQGSWAGICIGHDKIAGRFSGLSLTDGLQGSLICFTPTAINHLVASGNSKNYNYPSDVKIKTDGTRYCVKIVANPDVNGTGATVDQIDADPTLNTADVYIVEEPIGRTASTVIDYGEKVATVLNTSVYGYFSFGSITAGTTTFSNIKVTDANGDVMYEPATNLLGDEVIEHIVGTGSPDYFNREFRVWNSVVGEYAEMINNGLVSRLQLSKSSHIISKQDVETNDKLYSVYDISYYMDIKELGAGMDIIVGGNEADGYASIKVTAEAKSAGGHDVTFSDGTNQYTQYIIGSTAYNLAVKSNGDVILSIAGSECAKLNVGKAGGKIGFKTGADGETASDYHVQIYALNVDAYTEMSSDASSVSIDFSVMDPQTEKSYINNEEVRLYGSAMVVKGYEEVVFSNAKKDSMIATNEKYGDYVVKFDLVDLSQDDSGNIVVMSFGKETRNATYDKCPSMIFVARSIDAETGEAGKTNIEALNGVTFDTGKTSIALPDNFMSEMVGYSEEEGHRVLNVMIVVNNRTVTVHYKYGDEPESKLAIVRARIENVNTFGYFSLGATTSGNFSVKNFSLTNLSVG